MQRMTRVYRNILRLGIGIRTCVVIIVELAFIRNGTSSYGVVIARAAETETDVFIQGFFVGERIDEGGGSGFHGGLEGADYEWRTKLYI